MIDSSSYHYAGDLSTCLLCLVYIVVLQSSYVPKKKSYALFYYANIAIACSAISSMLYFFFQYKGVESIIMYSILGIFKMECLAIAFYIFGKYICLADEIEKDVNQKIQLILRVVLIVFSVIQVCGSIFRVGIRYDQYGGIYQSFMFSPFQLYYVIMMMICLWILFIRRKSMITAVWICLLQNMGISASLIVFQNLIGDKSFTSLSFALPLGAILSLFHYNAYDAETGTLNMEVFQSVVLDLKDKGFGSIFLCLKNTDPIDIRNLRYELLHFNEHFFKGVRTFRVNKQSFVMLYPLSKNENYKDATEKMLESFVELYRVYQNDYKVICLDTHTYRENVTLYPYFFKLIASQIEWNTTRICNEDDVKKVKRTLMIRDLLADIHKKQNLEDDRVLVFCQPVYNTKTRDFSTAEALMRLKDGENMIFPNEFIQIAEENGYIHTLSKIILNKTCKIIKKLSEKRMLIERISVNIAMDELHDPGFCDDIIMIIEKNGIEAQKIAIELTESRNEQDYHLVKEIMTKLRKVGIQFYLDDFGTGYSNIERIVELPFDIIKFDRSLTILAGEGERSKYMVGSFSNIFDKSKYKILFEGVENEKDEHNCVDMKAKYLQGYKYSKPVPIEQLEDFLHKSL